MLGVFHELVRNRESPLFKIGVWITGGYERLASSVGSASHSRHATNCPSFGSVDRSWCLTKARIEANMTIQVCRNSATEETCTGLLLTYANGSRDSLGDLRFDKYLSAGVFLHDCEFYNTRIEDKFYIFLRMKSTTSPWTESSSSDWTEFPTTGRIEWWGSWHGHKLEIST